MADEQTPAVTSPITQDNIGSFCRLALASLSTFLIGHHIVSSTLGNNLIAAAPFVSAVVWMAWNNYLTRQKLLVSIANPQLKTEAAVIEHIEVAKDLGIHLPSVSTPVEAIPDRRAPGRVSNELLPPGTHPEDGRGS